MENGSSAGDNTKRTEETEVTEQGIEHPPSQIASYSSRFDYTDLGEAGFESDDENYADFSISRSSSSNNCSGKEDGGDGGGGDDDDDNDDGDDPGNSRI